MPSDDINDMLESDKEKVQNAVSNARGGPSLPGPVKAMEHILWMLAVGGIAFMMVTMYFTGQDGPIEGKLWLGLSLLSICVPAALAMLIRWLRMGGGRAIDNILTEWLE